jgi:hypothetical protein
MATRNYQMRLERVERAAKAQSKYAPGCICFPENERPGLPWPSEERIASAVKCPLHGDRFRPYYFIYVAKWERNKREQLLETHHSEQYRKAWRASFPPELWPAQEEETPQGLVLKLKDGTRIPI